VRRHYTLTASDQVVLFSGRMAYQKGPDLLIESIPKILGEHPDAKFVFVGDGAMRWGCEERARWLGVERACRFLGYRSGDELVELYKASDAVCVPSRNEPFGIVVLEAWSAGKPVVVSQNGGPNEFVWHDVNGLKIYPDSGSVAWGVSRLLGDRPRARWMGRNGRMAAEVGFTWDAIADRTLSAYHS
jgi:glycosyltransferase involved in cell wall biosynthesis